MTPLAQVRHVLAKDVREFRWMIVAYVILVASAAARSASPGSLPGLTAPMVIIVLLGMVAVATAVQTDSPTRSDAFWASHPLRPSAMFGAKTAFAVMLLVIGLVGQAAAIRSYQVPWPEVVPMLGRTLAVSAVWLLAAMLLAAVTRDVRSFLLALVGLPMLGLTLTLMVAPAGGSTDSATSVNPALIAGAGFLAAAAGFLLVAWLYRSRDARRRTQIVAFSLALAALLMSLAGPPRADTGTSVSPNARIAVTLEAPSSGSLVERSELQLALAVPPIPNGTQLLLEPGSYVITLRNGDVLRVPSDRVTMALNDLGPSMTSSRTPAGVRWLNEPLRSPLFRQQVSVPLTPEQRRAIATGIARIVLEGKMVVNEARELGVLRLNEGSRIVKDGHRLRIADWSHDAINPSIEVFTHRIERRMGDAEEAAAGLDSPILCALINPARGEGVVLSRRSSSAADHGLVLPGVGMRGERGTYEPQQYTHAQPLFDDGWLESAELLVLVQVPAGSYPVRLELIVP